MKYIQSVTLLCLSVLFSGCVVVASAPSRADFHQQKTLVLDANALKGIDIEAGSGSMVVQGKVGLSEIHVTADIYTDRKNPNAYELTLKKRGSRGYLVAKNTHSFGFWNGDSPRIDIVIYIPKIMNVEIEDGSGEMDVTNIDGTLNIKDGSGSMSIENISSTIIINDGSGSIHINNTKGDINVVDGSGDLIVKKVSGLVTIDDGSGDIDIDDAGGLTIINSGSGDLRINKVKGSLKS